MKKTALIASVVLLVLSLAAAIQAEPQMIIPSPEFDFGYVPQHSTISHIFWLHSAGTDTLKIVNVKPG
jgi:hypothetical protein